MSGRKRSHDVEVDNNNNNLDYENRENGSHSDYDEDNDNDAHHRGNNTKSSKKQKNKKNRPSKIMSESGQTDADRRLLRRKQRELHNDIAVGGGDGAAAADAEQGGNDDEGGVDELTRLRTQNNDLWRDVRYTREAVLDSENVDLIASKAARQAEKVVQVPRYDAVRVAQALVKKGTVRTGGSSTQFNWRGLGFQVGVCFNALPSHVSFLYGPLDAEYVPKERKERQQRRKATQSDDEEEEQPEDVNQVGKKKESDGNELSAVQKHISVINGTLKEKASEARSVAIAESEEYATQLEREHPADEATIRKKKVKFIKEKSQVHAVNCLFNPKSFTQTVENVFHFSFLVKDSLAGIKARSVEEARECGDVPGPVIRPEKTQDVSDTIAKPTQAIVSLNMKDWRDMCKAYNVEESHVPHRVDGKVAKKEKGRVATEGK